MDERRTRADAAPRASRLFPDLKEGAETNVRPTSENGFPVLFRLSLKRRECSHKLMNDDRIEGRAKCAKRGRDHNT
jgi:hypothetical protein